MTIDTHPYLTVKLFPLDEHGTRWTVFVKLAEPIHNSLVSGIRLVDTGGVQWLTGYVTDPTHTCGGLSLALPARAERSDRKQPATRGRVNTVRHGVGGPSGADGPSAVCRPGGSPLAMPSLICVSVCWPTGRVEASHTGAIPLAGISRTESVA